MNEQLQPIPAGYAELPEGIKQAVTPREYAWLTDTEKARLVQSETEPDWT